MHPPAGSNGGSMFEVYRVRSQFDWMGWSYAPSGACPCAKTHLDSDGYPTGECEGVVGTGCRCSDSTHCTCGIKAEKYAGDIWIVEAGHPNKEMMLDRLAPGRLKAVYDASLPTADELLATAGYKVLLAQWMPGQPPIPRTPPALISPYSLGGVALADRP